MLRLCLFQIVRSLVASLYEQSRRLTVYEGEDALVHVLTVGQLPSEAFGQRVERPEACIVALCGNHLACACQGCHFASQVVGASNMS